MKPGCGRRTGGLAFAPALELALLAGLLLALAASPNPATADAKANTTQPESRPVEVAAQAGEESSIFREAAEPLGLSPEQLERLESISAESREYGAQIQAELQAAREEMKKLLEADEPEFAAVMAQADEIGLLETRMRKHHLATLLSLRAVLSADQRTGLIGYVKTATARKQTERAAAPTQGKPPDPAAASPP